MRVCVQVALQPLSALFFALVSEAAREAPSAAPRLSAHAARAGALLARWQVPPPPCHGRPLPPPPRNAPSHHPRRHPRRRHAFPRRAPAQRDGLTLPRACVQGARLMNVAPQRRYALMNAFLCQVAVTVAECRALLDPEQCGAGTECRALLNGEACHVEYGDERERKLP